MNTICTWIVCWIALSKKRAFPSRSFVTFANFWTTWKISVSQCECTPWPINQSQKVRICPTLDWRSIDQGSKSLKKKKLLKRSRKKKWKRFLRSLDEFSRAVKICTGLKLSDHLIETVFAIFDEDGDGLLSYKEFIAIMKDRLHRGFKVSNYGMEYNEELTDEYEEGVLAFSIFMRSRACRKLRRHFKFLQY